MGALRISDFAANFSQPVQLGHAEGGIAVDELQALASVDLVAPPELIADSPMSRAFGRNEALAMNLGPMEFPPATPQERNQAITRLVTAHSEKRSAPVSSANQQDVVREARMVVLVGQIHRLCQEIASRSRRPA